MWSFSLARTFERCQRQWYFKSHVASAQAKRDPNRRQAFLLSKLQSLEAWRGSLVDVVISNYVVPELRQGRLPDAASLVGIANDLFERQKAFALARRLHEPDLKIKKVGEEFAAFYDVEYGGELDDAAFEVARQEVETAVLNLVQMDELLGRLASASRLVAQRRLSFDHYGTSVRAVPDLIAFFPLVGAQIIDWKVHRHAAYDSRAQLVLYAVALTRMKAPKDLRGTYVPRNPARVRLLEVQLLTNTLREFTVTPEDVEDVEFQIAQSSTRMRLALGAETAGTSDPFDFPAALSPRTCEECPFRALCWDDHQ